MNKKKSLFSSFPLLLPLILGGIVLLFLSPFWNSYLNFLLITLSINIILTASLNLVNGYMGEFSVGHAGLMALGAYSSAIITVKLFPTLPALFLFPLALLIGGMTAGVVAVPLAIFSFKTRGDYLAIMTLALLMIVKSGIENISYIGGPGGFLGIRRLTTLPWAYFAVIITLLTLYNLLNSSWGRAIEAIREDEIAAEAMGVKTGKTKLIAFIVSSFFAGVAGALFAHQLQFVSPDCFDILKSTEILLMVYLGGVASLSGSVLGAATFTLLMEVLQPLGIWRMVLIPLLLILLMLFRPRGMMGFQEWPWLFPKNKMIYQKNTLFKKKKKRKKKVTS